MFGQNPVEKQDFGNGETLRVVQGSPFYTIQGEGPYAGRPAVFLRLHGCPLRCFFCDTQFSDPTDPEMTVAAIVERIQGIPRPANKSGLLVITGGEPTRQNLEVLIDRVRELDWVVQIETAGVFWQDCLRDTTIIVSPKTPRVNPDIWYWASAFKYVIRAGSTSMEDGLPIQSTQVEGKTEKLARPPAATRVYLSPMDEYDPAKNLANKKAVAEIAMKYGYIAGIQLHKELGGLP